MKKRRETKEIEELKRQSDQQHRDAIERLRRAKEEARRRGVPLHQIIPVH